MLASITLTVLCALGARTGMAQTDKPGTLTLDQAVQFALQHSPDLQTATAEIQKQEGNAKSAKSPLLPQVDLLADASRYRVDHGILPGADPRNLHFDNMIYTTGAELHFLVWDFGKTSAQLQATCERLDSSKLLLDRQREEVIYNVASLFLKAETYDDLIEAAQARKKSLEVLLDQTQQLLKGGRAVPLDLLKVQTRLAQVESDIATLQRRAARHHEHVAGCHGLGRGSPNAHQGGGGRSSECARQAGGRTVARGICPPA